MGPGTQQVIYILQIVFGAVGWMTMLLRQAQSCERLCVSERLLLCLLQMSELIQAAADDAQREVQHTHLLAQVQQLYQLIGQQGASQPTAQLAAVLAYVERVSFISLNNCS